MELMLKVSEFNNLYASWCKVRRKRGAPGVDGITVPIFRLNAQRNLMQLQKEILDGTYSPSPLIRVYVPKDDGAKRALDIPTVQDRIAQHAVLRAASPTVDSLLGEACFAYRQGSSVRDALSQIKDYYNQGFSWGLKADFKSYFDTVDHEILLQRLNGAIEDKNLIQLITLWVKTEVIDKGNSFVLKRGVPQGAPISCLLANLYLIDFDRKVHTPYRRLVRYGDDILVLCRRKSEVIKTVELIESILQTLRLSLNPQKTSIINFEEVFQHLGATILRSMVLIPPPRKPSPSEEESGEHREFDVPISGLAFKGKQHDRGCSESSFPLIRTLYVQEQGSVIRRHCERFRVCKGDKDLLEVPAIKVNQIAIFGNCTITTPAMTFALHKRIPILLFSQKGRFYGTIEPEGTSDVELQKYQFLRSLDPDFCLTTARAIVKGKIHNLRMFLLRRNYKRACEGLTGTINTLVQLIGKLKNAKTLCELRGYEGKAAAIYFGKFKHLLKYQMGFEKRKHHPPPDPVNSLLSFGYTLLFNNIYFFVKSYGLNPYVGYFHASRRGHPTFVSDLIEEFRAPIVDSLVVYLINSRSVQDSDFYYPTKEDGKKLCLLTNPARKRFIEQFEIRMSSQVTHQLAHRKISWRDCINFQVRQMVQYVKGQKNVYKTMEVKF